MTQETRQRNRYFYRGEIIVWSKEETMRVPGLLIKPTHDKRDVIERLSIFLITWGIATPEEFNKVMEEVAKRFKFREVIDSVGGGNNGKVQ